MRIDRIDIIRVLNPFKHPFQTSFTKFENRGIKLGHGVWDVIFRRV